ncbi:MAG: hypothetical protein POELPBGB_02785 [Bacteroidia bacterium]|nr:hypothetical protein [Bacteroidia bacterium]
MSIQVWKKYLTEKFKHFGSIAMKNENYNLMKLMPIINFYAVKTGCVPALFQTVLQKMINKQVQNINAEQFEIKKTLV